MKTLVFEQIVDSRDSSDLLTDISKLKNGVADQLDQLKGVKFRWLNQRILKFEDGDVQRRVTFHVQKSTRKVTWNDVYKAVNEIKAVPYKFENHLPIEEIEQSPFYQQL